PVASLVLLWANRLIPAELEHRASVEAWSFVLAWLAVALATLVSSRQPLARARALLGVMAALALGLPLENFLTAPYSHLLASFGTAPELALVDRTLISGGLLLAWDMASDRRTKPAPAARKTE